MWRRLGKTRASQPAPAVHPAVHVTISRGTIAVTTSPDLSTLMSMAVVSHPALSAEWSFPTPINPFDAPSFNPHADLDHTSVHHIPIVHKRRAHEIDWDDEDLGQKVESRAKKAKTSSCLSVEPHQLHRESVSPAAQAAPLTSQSPQIEQVISIIVDALTSNTSTTETTPSSAPSDPPITVLSSNVPVTSVSSFRSTPTSPLSDSPDRAPFVRKVIGGSCAGKTEPSLYRWVLCKNHFLRWVLPVPERTIN